MNDDTPKMKKCTNCKQMKPATTDFFYKNGGSRKGLSSMCIVCKSKYHRQYYLYGAKETVIAKDGFKICSSCKNEFPSTSEYFRTRKDSKDGLRGSCIVCQDKKRAQYREKNHASILESKRKSYQRNKKSHTEYMKKYAAANRKENNRRSRNWVKNNPEKRRTVVLRYRSRKRELPDTFTSEQWITCLEYFNYTCPVCDSQLRDLFGNVEPHADHWIPLSYEGDDNPGTVAENIVCLCNSCNCSKNATLPDVWLKGMYGAHKASKILEKINRYFSYTMGLPADDLEESA